MNTKKQTDFPGSNIGRAVGATLPVLLAVGVAAVGLLAAALPAQAQLNRAPYLQSLSGTSATISWRTSTAEDSRVQYGSAPGLLTSESTRAASVKTHDVSLTDLVPGTRYYYSVGSSSTVHAGDDADHWFDTAPAAGSAAPFTAWLIGDSGSLGVSGAGINQLIIRNQALAFMGGNPDIVIHAGDIAYPWGTLTAFTENYFGVYADILRNQVGWPTPGNHDETGVTGSDPVTETGPYFEAFSPPTAGQSGGVASGTELYYSFDYGNAHFISLDSHFSSATAGSAMMQWLFEDLAATTQPWLIAFWHHPPYTKGTHDSDLFSDGQGRHQNMRENALSLLEAGGVDLVLTGHSHAYERSFLVNGVYCPSCGAAPDLATPDFATISAAGHVLDAGDGSPAGDGAYSKSPGLNSNEGAVHIVAGHSGGYRLGLASLHPVMYFAEDVGGSVVLDFNGSSVTVSNIQQGGAVSDSFTMVKRVEACAQDSDCDDANPCTDDSCTLPAGDCAYTPNSAGCSDGDVCNGVEICDGAGGCIIDVAPLVCGDGDSCTVDLCDAVTGCDNVAVAEYSCLDAAKVQFAVSDKDDDSKDKLKWAWIKGEALTVADFGDLDEETTYSLCVYDYQGGTAVYSTQLDVGPGAPFAKAGTKGWKYKDKLGVADGLSKIKMGSGAAGKSKIIMLAKGANVPLAASFSAEAMFAADTQLGVGLINSDGQCWRTVFTAADVKKNTASTFKAKAKQ